MTKCPKCKNGELREEVNLVGMIFSRKKLVTNYCVLCGWKSVTSFKLNEGEYQALLEKKGGSFGLD